MSVILQSSIYNSFLTAFIFFSLCYGQSSKVKPRVEFEARRNGISSELLDFNNIVIAQSQGGFIYVGARNRLYQLDENLKEVGKPVVTGPVANDIVCKCKRNGKTDNINKLLLIDNRYRRIVVCGSVEQGICDLRELGNIQNVLSLQDFNLTASSIHHVAASKYFSTVGFIARTSNNKEYLFVGSSKVLRDDPAFGDTQESSFYTISKRALPENNLDRNMFSVNIVDDIGYYNDVGIRMKKAYSENKAFRLTFIDSFADGITGYFVLTYPPLDSSSHQISNTPTTYIGQVCLNKYDMSSYLELPVECTVQGIKYTKAIASHTAKVGSKLASELGIQTESTGDPSEVVFISFVQNNGRPGSAVCMFSLQDIETKFVELTIRCMRDSAGPTPKSIPWLKSENPECGKSYLPRKTPVCASHNMWDVIKHLQDEPYTKNAFYATNKSAVTAIEVLGIDNSESTVAFFGTDDGRLIKLRIGSATMNHQKNVEYETTVIHPSIESVSGLPANENYAAVKSIKLGYGESTEKRRLYAMTSSILVGLPLVNCSQYTSCSRCLGSKDPFCGWCTLESKCSSAANCPHSSSPFQYIESGGECPKLTSETPLILTATQSQEPIIVYGHNIPQENYLCSFGDIYTQRATSVTYQPSTKLLKIRCVSPPRDNIPKFAEGKGELKMLLSLLRESDPLKKTVVSTNFTFYKCSVFTSCMSCVSTQYNCSWCLNDNLCTHKSNTDCPHTDVKQSNSCPQLASLSDGDNKVYLAAGRTANIDLPVKMVPAEWNIFYCELSMNGDSPQRVRAEKSGNTITCNNVMGNLPNNKRSILAAIRVLYSGPDQTLTEIDNPVELSVEIYQCGMLSSENCGNCLQSSLYWHCGWCESSTSCTLSGDCTASWLEASKSQSCRNPEITEFFPTSAPFSGNSTVIRLKGVNFDRNGKMRISVAGVNCKIVTVDCCEASCIPTSKNVMSGPIRLCISDSQFRCLHGGDYATSTTQSFAFVDPKIQSFEPSSGLRGWGTRVTISGEYLDTGNSVMVTVDGKSCLVKEKTSNKIHCNLKCTSGERKRRDVIDAVLKKLSRSRRSTTERRLTATFDGVTRVSKSGYFDFVDSVNISSIEPSSTIQSGGLPLMVRGVNLALIRNPRILVTLYRQTHYGSCTILPRNTLKCESPAVSLSTESINDYSVAIVSSDCPGRSVWYKHKLRYGPNPTLDKFEGPDHVKIFRNETIYISGENLCPDRAHCDDETVRVLIGEDKSCNVTRLDVDQISCEPESADIGKYEVKVIIGGYSQFVGDLEYATPYQFPSYVIAIIVIMVIICLLGFFIAFCIYRRRAKASDDQVKNMQIQMNIMESKVAKVCKEAFAELQTDMTNLDTIGGGVGIPYLHYREYLMRVLFPDPVTSHRQHSLLLRNMERNDSRNSNRGMLSASGRLNMDRFNQLLENKIFLLSFIKAVERQRTFTMKDRAQVAGLILIILQNRLAYATEILEHLLADLIRRNMESKNHPKLLLRRTESVAEKMLTHWFTILLYRFVVDCAGEPLFTLYRAINYQVDKGPLDVFTSEARYSLSEDKLLRQSVDHEVVVLRVVNYMANYDQPEFTAKVLSCDSISQVKRKIVDVAFVNVRCGDRPHLEDIDLEYTRDGIGSFILRDEDHTSTVEGEWKKINTLDHYSVKNNDLINLIPRRETPLNHSNISNASRPGVRRNGSGTRLLQSMEGSNSSLPRHRQQASRAGTPTLQQDGTKLYHLVKQSDQDQKEGSDRGKMVSEIYLTRLLTTKGTIQKYVDDLFETIFSVSQRGYALPLAVKHMFDFLDHQADIHGITDPQTVHTWKSNCLPLRFWVNLIKNPEFVYDVNKSPIVDCYLSVIAQAFMDSCSTAEYKLGKDSPSNKLLYAKEIPEYREWVSRYYADISNMPRLNPRDLSAFLQEESVIHSQDFNTQAALSQLYTYLDRYNEEVMQILESNPEAQRQHLMKQLEDLIQSMNGGRV